MNLQDNGPLIRTLRLTPQERAELLGSLGKDSQPAPGTANRRTPRVPFRVGAVIILLTHPGQATVKYSVVPRNLSTRGLAFIHGQFVHPQSVCRAVMPNLAGQWVVVDGRVARCRHVRGLIHEVSVVFEEMLDLALFVDAAAGQTPGTTAATQPAAAAPTSLAGKVLLVDDFAGDRRLFAFWLGKRGATVVEAADAQAAQRAAEEHAPIDLALVDLHLGADSGLSVVRTLRERGFAAPVIAVSADSADEAQAAALAAGCNAFLTKPCDRARFLGAAEQLLRCDWGGGAGRRPIRSALAADAEMAPLIREFAASLAGTIGSITHAEADGDLPTLRTICHHLKGSGASYGFEPVSEAARTAMAYLRASPPEAKAVHQAISELIATLQRVEG